LDLWSIENQYRNEGHTAICGVDEAGRGPLAGPVYAAAVILPFGIVLPGLNDSKKLSAHTREKLYETIVKEAVAYGIASADNNEIDNINILNATFLAMDRAIQALSVAPDIVLVDGNRAPVIEYPIKCIVGGDGKSASIAAASILAKVSRDAYMTDMAVNYPGYGFENHKGYGTKQHIERLREQGPCGIHRKTFLNVKRKM